ncbi:MAG: GNAT family N-acetyltransferase [Roseibium sp.]
MQPIILECDTVQLVPLSLADTEQVRALHADPFGNQCTELSANCTLADAEDLVRSALRDQQDHGFAKWKAVSKDGEFVGWAGFTPLSETSEISLNYSLSSAVTNDEASLPKRLCSKLADWFFENTYYSHLVAAVRTDNRDMRDVVLGAGFKHRESQVIGGMQADLFQLLSPSMQSYLMTA